MFCNKCGARINIEEDVFCMNCGAKIAVRTGTIDIPSGLTQDAEESVRIIDDFFVTDDDRRIKQAILTEELQGSIESGDEDPEWMQDLELFEIPEIVLEFKEPEGDSEYPELPKFSEKLTIGETEHPREHRSFEKSVEEGAEKAMAMVDQMFADLSKGDIHKSNDARANLSKAVDAALEEERIKKESGA